jgi:hypothetical protein
VRIVGRIERIFRDYTGTLRCGQKIAFTLPVVNPFGCQVWTGLELFFDAFSIPRITPIFVVPIGRRPTTREVHRSKARARQTFSRS